MNIANAELAAQIEKAVKFLCDHMPVGEERKKPLLMHALRVGMYLYDRDYSEDIVLGGFLHDVLEWTGGSEDQLREIFGQRVCDIVKANTKDRDIEDPAERRREYIARCFAVGEDAVIVKAADTLDSYRFYQAIDDAQEVERCVDIAHVILENLPTDFRDPIFESLRELQ